MKKLNNHAYYLTEMNNLIIVVGITIVSLLFASPFLKQTQNIYEHEAYGQGYNILEIKDLKGEAEGEDAIEEAEEEDDD